MRYDREAHIQLFGDRQVAQQYVSFARKLLGQLYTYNHALSPITPSGYSTRTIRLEDGATIQVIWTGALPILRIFSPPFKPPAEAEKRILVPEEPPIELTDIVYAKPFWVNDEYFIVQSDVAQRPPTKWATVPGLTGIPAQGNTNNISGPLMYQAYTISPDLTQMFHIETKIGTSNETYLLVNALTGAVLAEITPPVEDVSMYDGFASDGYVSAIQTDGKHIYVVTGIYMGETVPFSGEYVYGFEVVRLLKYSLAGALLGYTDILAEPAHRLTGGVTTYFCGTHIHNGYLYVNMQYATGNLATEHVRVYAINLGSFSAVNSTQITNHYSQRMSLGGSGNRVATMDLGFYAPEFQTTIMTVDGPTVTVDAQFALPTIDYPLNPGLPSPCVATKSHVVLSGIYEFLDSEWGVYPVLDINTTAYNAVAVIPEEAPEFDFLYPEYFLSLAS